MLVELGVDINNKWNFNEKGDLELISYEDNLKQAIKKRLTTKLDELDLYYDNYGSSLQNMLGSRRNKDILKFVKIEIESCLSQEPRISAFEVEVTLNTDGIIEVKLELLVNEEELTYNMVINEDEVIEDGTG